MTGRLKRGGGDQHCQPLLGSLLILGCHGLLAIALVAIDKANILPHEFSGGKAKFLSRSYAAPDNPIYIAMGNGGWSNRYLLNLFHP